MGRKVLDQEINNLESMIKMSSLSSEESKEILKQITIIKKKKHTPKTENDQIKTRFSGLQKPLVVSHKMNEFAGWNLNDLHSRVDVTNVICEYIKKNHLQKEDDRRIIMLDNCLKDLLHTYDKDTITYPVIQKYIGAHLSPPIEPIGTIEEVAKEVEVAKEDPKDLKKKQQRKKK